jgi:hypothetical protein
MMRNLLIPAGGLLLALLLVALPVQAGAGTLRERFSAFDSASSQRVDHSLWQRLLKQYVVVGEDGLARVDYARFKGEGAKDLERYLQHLQRIDVGGLTRPEQFAFWVNLYNARTVDIILAHYPVGSIRNIRLSGFLFPGPWREKVVTVGGERLSLNDVEHEILRPIWKDPRIHYAVNCASVGCPNLMREAFTGENVEALLEKGAGDYVNSPRGVRVTDAGVRVSKIYSWYDEDFGGSEKGVLDHIRRYADADLAARLAVVRRIAGYDYDWSLNDK